MLAVIIQAPSSQSKQVPNANTWLRSLAPCPWQGLDAARAALERAFTATPTTSSANGNGPNGTSHGGDTPSLAALGAKVEEAGRIRDLLCRNTEELSSALHALGGGYVLPEAGGDLLRDGAGACVAV